MIDGEVVDASRPVGDGNVVDLVATSLPSDFEVVSQYS